MEKWEVAIGNKKEVGKVWPYFGNDSRKKWELKMENGMIRGERYARRLVKDEAGNNIKDHWELKGKATE